MGELWRSRLRRSSTHLGRPYLLRLLILTLAFVLAGCNFDFQPNIEPLIFPTAPPQPFSAFAPTSEPTIVALASTPISRPSFEEIQFRDSSRTQGVFWAIAGMGPLAAGFGALWLSMRSKGAKKALTKQCYGGVVAGVLGFFALFPVDSLMGEAMASLAATGPQGVILDLFVLAPVELVVLDLHVAFSSLAYHSTDTQCSDLKLKKYLLPPWGFGQ